MVDNAYPVRRRLVLNFPGFEPMPAEAHTRRFVREAAKNAPVFDMALDVGEASFVQLSPTSVSAGAVRIVASGSGWSATSDVVVYGLGDLNGLYSARPKIVRLLGGFGALLDFIFSGTFVRFLRTSARYGMFFAYPFVLTLLYAGIALLAALAPLVWIDTLRWWSIPIALGVFWALVYFGARRMHYLLIMDDWTFARDVARGRRPDIQARLRLVSEDVVRRIRASDADEIVFAAHSFGAITAVLALSEALGHAAGQGRPIGLLTVGSSLLKVALHPAAEGLRDATRMIVEAGTPWLDAQSLTDPMNFYKSNPAGSLGIDSGRRPHTTAVRFRNQLTPETYRAIRRDMFRVHRQFVFALERRQPYSFHAILLGPEPFEAVAVRGGVLDAWGLAASPGSATS